MVVTSSRLHAVRYMQAFQRYIAENKSQASGYYYHSINWLQLSNDSSRV